MPHDLRNLPDAVRERLTRGFGDDFLSQRHRGFDLDYKGRTLEVRATPRIELRKAANGAPAIVGYASIYDAPYEILGGAPYGWTEIIAKGAASKSIAERDDVYLFFDHEGLPLSSTKNGTLHLESDSIGLFNESRIDTSSPWSMEILRRVEDGTLDAMSFAFQVTRQRWEDEEGNEADPMTAPVRRIQEVKLYDVSVVSFPANPATGVMTKDQARSAGMSLTAARAAMDALRSSAA